MFYLAQDIRLGLNVYVVGIVFGGGQFLEVVLSTVGVFVKVLLLFGFVHPLVFYINFNYLHLTSFNKFC